MALAPVAYCLWQEKFRYAPGHPEWVARDRFVLSCGHASMLIYSLLHLAGVQKVDGSGKVLDGDYIVYLAAYSLIGLDSPLDNRLASSLLGVADKFPAMSTTISNVPGPRDPLYLRGAKVKHYVPVSTIAARNAACSNTPRRWTRRSPRPTSTICSRASAPTSTRSRWPATSTRP